MDLQQLTIAYMAQLHNVTTETLRHYDRQGLLHPFYTDRETGYRYYHINQCARLDMIQFLQSHNIPLREVRRYLELTNTEAICELLNNQVSSIDDSIRRLTQSRFSIGRMLANHERCKHMPQDGTIFFEYIKARKIFKHQTDQNLFEQDITGYEMILRQLKQSMIKNRLPMSYFFNAGSLIRQDCLKRNVLYSDEVFFFVEDSYTGPGEHEVLPEALYVCCCSNDFSEETECARHLIEHIAQTGYEISGDYVCEVIEEFPGFEAGPRKLFYKIQIPVKKFTSKA